MVDENDGTTTGDPVPGTTVTTVTNPDGTVTTTVNQGTTGDPLGAPAAVPIGQDSGLWAGREAMSDALGRAEEVLAGYLGYSLGKKNHCDTVAWPRKFNQELNPCTNVQLKKGKVDAIGRVESVRVMDLNLTLVDRNGDLFVDGFEGGGFLGGVDLRKDNVDSFFLRQKRTDPMS